MKQALIGLVVAVALGYGGVKVYLHHKASNAVDAAVAAMSPFAEIRYSGVSSTLSGDLTIDDVRIQVHGFRDEVAVGRLGITTPHFLALLKLVSLFGEQAAGASPPEYFGLIAEEIRVYALADYFRHAYAESIKAISPPDIDQRGVQCVGKYGFSPQTLKALGYEELVISMSIILRQVDTSFITEVDFNAEDMMDVAVKIRMVGDMLAGAAMGAGYQPTLHSLEMVLRDRSLVRRVEQHCTELGLTPEQILAAHLNALQYAGKAYGIEFDSYVIDPYKAFLAGKPTLTVTARPREPLRLTRIRNYHPSDVPALLNLEAAAQ